MDAAVPGADAVAIHLDWRPATTGIAPSLPEQNLRQRAYWVDPTVVEQPAFTWVLGTDVSIGPVQVPARGRPAPGRQDRGARVGSAGRGHRHRHPSRPRDRLGPMTEARRPPPAPRDPLASSGWRWSRVHTSPLDQPGTGDAGGMNVYVVEVARRLARAASRSTCSPAPRAPTCPPVVEVEPGRRRAARHGRAVRGPGQGGPARPAVRLRRRDDAGRGRTRRPATTTWCTRTTGSPGRSAGWPPTAGACRWCTPMHTMARVKNLHLADGDAPEPRGREIGEAQVVEAADRLVANTHARRTELVDLYDADPAGWSSCRAGRRPRRVHPRLDGAAARAGAGHAPRCRAAAVRRPDPAAQGTRRAASGPPLSWCAAGPSCARGSSSPSSAGRAAPGCASPDALHRAGRAARHR